MTITITIDAATFPNRAVSDQPKSEAKSPPPRLSTPSSKRFMSFEKKLLPSGTIEKNMWKAPLVSVTRVSA